MTPRDQLAAIRKFSTELYAKAHEHLQCRLLPELQQAGIQVSAYNRLSKEQKEKVDPISVKSCTLCSRRWPWILGILFRTSPT
jgi:polyphosphate kinase